ADRPCRAATRRRVAARHRLARRTGLRGAADMAHGAASARLRDVRRDHDGFAAAPHLEGSADPHRYFLRGRGVRGDVSARSVAGTGAHRMTPQAIGGLGILVLMVLTFARIPLGAAMGLVGLVGYAAI